MFEGHEMIKLNKEWLFDITEFKLYRVWLDRDNSGKVKDYKLAMIITLRNGKEIAARDKYLDIPVAVIKKVDKIIEKLIQG